MTNEHLEWHSESTQKTDEFSIQMVRFFYNLLQSDLVLLVAKDQKEIENVFKRFYQNALCAQLKK